MGDLNEKLGSVAGEAVVAKPVTLEEIKGLVFAPASIIEADTSTSGKCYLGKELTYTLGQTEYLLKVDVSGVLVSEVVASAAGDSWAVRSQRWCRTYAGAKGEKGLRAHIGGRWVAASAAEPVAKWTGGTLRLTYAELFPPKRAAAPTVSAEVQVKQGLARMGREERRAILEEMLREEMLRAEMGE